ncbi:MAG: arylsulfatase [Ilumatobacteraceae bacterium]
MSADRPGPAPRRAHPAEPSFGGTIGDTLADSAPWWPPLPSGTGKPNVVMIVLDDTGFAHFGCYGSTLATPNIDRLAANGLRYTNFHTTALCSPTRACLLSGRNHHSVGMRGVSNWNTGFPHMRGGISPHAATVPEVLRPHGYATYAAGKWHLAPMEECSAAGPHHNWPLQKGFDRYYGFLQGETDQFAPELTHDNHHVDPPHAHDPDGGRPYHVSEDIIDRSISWLRDLESVRPDRPFFLYLAFGAMHAPHQAPPEYLARWRGAFDEGYESWRDRWFERQVQMGVVPEGTALAPRNPGVPAWEELTPNQRTFANRLQEAFAAMLEHTDHQIGRLTAFLDAEGLLDDTLLMVLSDNGASREGGPYGVMDEWSFFNGLWEDIDSIVEHRLDDIGGPHSHSNYPWGWAQAGNSPLRWYKQNTYGGGVRDPLVVHWPAGIPAAERGGFRRQFCHAIDLAATVLDITGADMPDSFHGVEQMPVHGASLAGTFASASAPAPRDVQYFEQIGHRGIYADGWKATTYHEGGRPFSDDTWGLYCLDDDFSECRDRAGDDPDRLAAMVALWWQQADQHGVLPLDDRTIELFGAAPRPGTPHFVPEGSGDPVYTYRPPMSHLPSDASPNLGGRNWDAEAAFTVTGPALPSGVLYARGSHNVGHCWWVADGIVHFDYNALGAHSRASAPLPSTLTAPGRHTLGVRFRRDGKGGTVTVLADGAELATAAVPRIVRILGSTGADIGRGPLNPVVDDLDGPAPFSPPLETLVFRVLSRQAAVDTAADTAATARAEMSRE